MAAGWTHMNFPGSHDSTTMAALQDEGLQAVCATLQRLACQELANAERDHGRNGQNFTCKAAAGSRCCSKFVQIEIKEPFNTWLCQVEFRQRGVPEQTALSRTFKRDTRPIRLACSGTKAEGKAQNLSSTKLHLQLALWAAGQSMLSGIHCSLHITATQRKP